MSTLLDADELEEFPDERRRHRKLWIVAGITLAVLSIGGFGAYRYVDAKVNPGGKPGADVQVTIPKGASTGDIAKILKRAGVIDNTTLFGLYERIDGTGQYQAGDYVLRKHESYKQIFDVLAAGSDITPGKITIPEGFTLQQIAARVGKLPGRSSQKFLDLAASGQVRSQFSPPGNNNLEGLLFPDTYLITDKDDELSILQRMVQAFDQQAVAAGLPDAATRLGLTPYQLVTVASMIEREAKVPEDRGKIASVIYNRLQRKMPLSIDATLMYALGRVDTSSTSPYNTYKIAGLPPTPIANPGRPSLDAAANPDTTPYLYYVIADADGRHAFATNLADHNKNIAAARAKGLLP